MVQLLPNCYRPSLNGCGDGEDDEDVVDLLPLRLVQMRRSFVVSSPFDAGAGGGAAAAVAVGEGMAFEWPWALLLHPRRGGGNATWNHLELTASDASSTFHQYRRRLHRRLRHTKSFRPPRPCLQRQNPCHCKLKLSVAFGNFQPFRVSTVATFATCAIGLNRDAVAVHRWDRGVHRH